MPEAFDLERYLTGGVEQIVKGLVKGAAFHPRAGLFMAQYALASKRASALRQDAEERGEHIPPFLIASITSLCNLHCAGCYARSLDTCVDGVPTEQMTGDDWLRVFTEARELGIGFILLAGGEPMVRRDVLEAAGQVPEILFPIFTNGTLMTGDMLNLLERRRNLAPVMSIEGGETETDRRRGKGVWAQVSEAMAQMRRRHILFGASVTVTTENLAEVTSEAFLRGIAGMGCKAVVFVEYVPTEDGTDSLALDDAGRETLARKLDLLRQQEDLPLMISFPGDEKNSGGCLAAGRGFFHINSHGGAEPCPFSPYSDFNVKEHSLREALQSKLFRALRDEGLLMEEHDGGCVLFRQRRQVEALLGAVTQKSEKEIS
ncbi:MAG: radical SAM protein [Christensenellaceae bacterium]|nr:radical SAM protein [Christensenellaceae bacterium]